MAAGVYDTLSPILPKANIPKGPRCLKCIDACPGLEVHFWRKVCKHCRCPQEDHDIQADRERDFRPISLLFDSTFSSTDGKSDWMAKFEKLNLQDPRVMMQMCAPQQDMVISRLISENLRSQKYVSMLPEDKQEFATQLRRRQLQRQLPLHDLDPRFCNSLTDKELPKYEKFAEKRRKKAAGIGNIGEVDSSCGCVKCHCCKGVMENKCVAVFAGRMVGTCWHPGCFTCKSCKELLVDNIYFYKGAEIYCGRHYADLLYPRCFACDEIIFAREYTQAENRSWHVQHFCCWYCDAPLAGQRYIAKNNNPYCIVCFDRLFSKICSTCQRPITADSPGMTHGDLHWHACPHCFSCHVCGTSLINNHFLLREGNLYCSVDCRQRTLNVHQASLARNYAT
ncbi:testin isoform X2 [Patella vulgata]|uniref:testin isoform X2 n=1 Tax=Patella vulgata TaxID=6465 RepID=UPI00217FEB46|nr:testin isoform X2 [Patella vulgata]